MATYLFDFDGTLVDSMPTFVAAFRNLVLQYGIACPDDFVKTITPLGYGGAAKHLVKMGVPLAEGEIVARVNAFAKAAYENTIVAKPSVKQTLEELRKKGDSLHILTASPHSVLDCCLEKNEIYDLFENVWSCEDFGTSKADPEIYHMAAKRIGKKVEEIIFLDDNLDACKTAKQAGMQVYGVFDETSRAYADEIKAATDRYITNFSELLTKE